MNELEKNGSQYYKKIIVALVLGWVAIWIYRTILTPVYPQIQSSLGDVSNAEIGLIASVYFFAYTGMQIPAGVLVDKFGQKAVLIPAFIGFAIGAVVLGTAGSLPQVYIGSLISGIATGSYYGLMGKLAIDPVLITYVSDSVPEQKTAKALGLFNFFGMVSSVVAPWLTGYIGDVTGSQVLAFYIGSILLIAAAVFFFFVIYLRSGKESHA